MTRKFILLDRDGVINEDSDDYIKSPEEWIPIPGSLAAIAKLIRAGYHVLVLTNQSGIARGYFPFVTLEAIHEKMHAALAAEGGKVHGVFYCPHGPEDACDCRKPKTGLFLRAAKAFDFDLHGVPAVGDSFRDLQSAREVGANPILVRSGKGERTLASKGQTLSEWGVPVYADLAAAVESLLSGAKVQA